MYSVILVQQMTPLIVILLSVIFSRSVVIEHLKLIFSTCLEIGHCCCLQTFSDPSLTDYELAKQKAIIAKNKDMTMPAATETILLMIETFKNAPHHEA